VAAGAILGCCDMDVSARWRPAPSLAAATWVSLWVSTPTVTRTASACAVVVTATFLLAGTGGWPHQPGDRTALRRVWGNRLPSGHGCSVGDAPRCFWPGSTDRFPDTHRSVGGRVKPGSAAPRSSSQWEVARSGAEAGADRGLREWGRQCASRAIPPPSTGQLWSLNSCLPHFVPVSHSARLGWCICVIGGATPGVDIRGRNSHSLARDHPHTGAQE
jgi:hypothetical protein